MAESHSLASVLKAHHEAETENAHTCLPCRVESYDAATQTVAAKPLVKRPGQDADGNTKFEELPTYPNVQVAFPRAGNFVMYMPIAAGDFGHLIFCDMATGEARSSGQVSEPQDLSRHAGGYCIFLPGGYPDPRALADHANAYTGLDGDDAQVEYETGEIRVGKGATDAVVLASALVQALVTAVTAATGSGGNVAQATLIAQLQLPAFLSTISAIIAKAK